MSCTPDIAAMFPNVDVILLTSSIQYPAPQSDSGATTSIVAASTDMEALAQSTTTPPTQAMIENPYSTLLRPRTYNDRLYQAPQIDANTMFIESIQFSVYDGRVNGSTLAQPNTQLYQDTTLNTEVETTQADATDKYLTSPYRFAMVGNWQPNWFRPFIKINNEIIFDSRQSRYGNHDNLGDIAYGYDLPFCIEPMKQIRYFTELTIAACAFQYVDSASARKLYRFPIHCEVTVRYR